MRVYRPCEWKVTRFIQVLSGEASLGAGSLAAWWILIWLRSGVHRRLAETRKPRFGVPPPPPPPFFCKCVKRKGFKSFVLKVCETKGVADAFLRKCVKLKSLGGIFVSLELF